ncbi:MAG: lysine N6-hydroxylase, partial [bacterium]
MRVCIAGGGIAGTLLAWRLAARPEVEHVELLLGEDRRGDATEQSGGVVRAYERHP